MNLNSKIKKCVYLNSEGYVIKAIPYIKEIYSQLNDVSKIIQKLSNTNILKYEEITECDGVIRCKSDFYTPLTNIHPYTLSRIDSSMDWIIQIGNALQHLHNSGLYHYNLKASNILVDNNGYLMLSDYYKSEIPSSYKSITFLPIEYIIGKKYTKESDVYSYGCLMYFILTGEAPFTSKSIKELIKMKKFKIYNRLDDNYPPMLKLIIDACLNNDPKNRLSIESVLYNLQHINSKSIKPVKLRDENTCKGCECKFAMECDSYKMKHTIDKRLLYNFYRENNTLTLLPILDFLLDNYSEKLELLLLISYDNPLYKYLPLIEKNKKFRIRCDVDDINRIKENYYFIKNLKNYDVLIMELHFNISTLNFLKGLIELPVDRERIIHIVLYYEDFIYDYVKPIIQCLNDLLCNKEIIITLDTSKVNDIFTASYYLQMTVNVINNFKSIHQIYFNGSNSSYFVNVISNNMDLIKDIHVLSINGSCIECFDKIDPIVTLSSNITLFNNLHQLSFSFRCSKIFMYNLLQLILDLKFLRCLNMTDCSFTHKALDVLCEYESNLNHLDELILQGNFVDKKHVNEFTRNINSLSNLKSLCLRRFNRFKSKGFFVLNMNKFNSLISLDVSRNGLDQYEQSILYSNFKYMPSLLKLDLSYNEIKQKTMKYLCSTIILLSKLEYLDICKMDITDKMIKFLKPSLLQLKRLKYLDMRKNKVGKKLLVDVQKIKVYLTELIRFYTNDI